MGCSASIKITNYQPTHAIKNQSRRNADIERQLQESLSINRRMIKMILLGAAESGKSTILKQIRILNGEGYSDEELRSKKSSILWNVLNCMITIVEAMEQLKLDFADPALNAKAAMFLNNSGLTPSVENIDPATKEVIKELWADPGLQNCYERKNEYQLTDCAKYFLDAVDRIAAPDYIPTVDDVLHSRIQTTGVVNLDFLINGVNFRVVDVGGQRSERRKWIHHFDDCNAVIFVTSLSEYDELCADDNETNRMIESLGLFEQICNSNVFENSSMILFFNKKDLFAEKIKKIPLTTAFKDYKGKQTYDDCVPYIMRCFELKKENEKKELYCHETCATNTNQVQLILESVWTTIIRNALKTNGCA